MTGRANSSTERGPPPPRKMESPPLAATPPPPGPGRSSGRGGPPTRQTSGETGSEQTNSRGRAQASGTSVRGAVPGMPPPSTAPANKALFKRSLLPAIGAPRGPTPPNRGVLESGSGSECQSSIIESLTLESNGSAATGTLPDSSNVGSGNVKQGGGADSTLSLGRGSSRGRADRRPDILKTRPEELVSKRGSSGDAVSLLTNHFQVNFPLHWTLKQYRVDFSPDEDNLGFKKAMLHQHDELLGTYIFDGTIIFTPQVYNQPVDVLSKTREGKNYRIHIREVGVVKPTDGHFFHFLNIIARNCLQGLKLQLIGRNYFDPEARTTFPEFKLEVWPGYMTSIRQHEEKVLICCDSGVKIIRTDSVLEQMTAIRDRGAILRKLLGLIVITRYNNRTYRIDDIDFGKNPEFKFQKGDKSEVSIKDYFKLRYNLEIKNGSQPLLVSQPKARDVRGGRTSPALLVPELCFMTGLGEEHQNPRVKNALGNNIRPTPDNRVDTLMKFSKRMQNTALVVKELSGWKMGLSPNILQIPARILTPEKIRQGMNKPPITYGVDNADWGSGIGRGKLLSASPLERWIVVAPQIFKGPTEEFVAMIPKVGGSMGFQIRNPLFHFLSEKRVSNYVTKLQEVVKLKPSMVMIIIDGDDIYKAVKKTLYVDNAIPCQVMKKSTLTRTKGLMSVATKVAIQMAAKLGAEPWGIVSVPKNTMVIGYDSFHDTANRNTSVGAVVASINNDLTRFTSSCTFHKNNEELLNQMEMCFSKAIQAYQKANGGLPERLIVYRDGVGDGQIEYVKETEIVAIQTVCRKLHFEPKLTFIIVSKRINARFFKPLSNSKVTNPPSGTIVDDVVTLPERYDFFLISQSVRQGTVNPTSYNVIEDNSGWSPDNIQRLTYKLTHLYFNWPGTVRVPAPCQYAHKLAYLVGESLHKSPNEALEDILYYL